MNINISLFTILLSLVEIISIQFLYQIIYNKLFHPLRHYPGPFWAGATRLWQIWHFIRGEEANEFIKAVQKYGPVIRISPTMLLVADAKALPAIYHRHDTKSRFYLSSLFEAQGVILIRNPDDHAAHRRLLGAPYSLSNIQRMEPLLNHFITWATYLSYDAITEVSFRKPVGFVEAGHDVGNLIKHWLLGLKIVGLAGRIPQLPEWFSRSWLRNLVIIKPGQTGLGAILSKADEVLEQRNLDLKVEGAVKPEKGDENYDFLQFFMDVRTPDGKYLDSKLIRAELLNILGAGGDGFRGMASAFMAEVMTSIAIRTRLYTEISTAVAAGELSQPVPTYAEVTKSLPFFVACIRETIRLHPIASSIFPREMVPGDPELVLCGRVVPVGTEVTSHPLLCQRDRGVFGEDAGVFKPERWLGDLARAKEYEKYIFTWGYGSRVCLGKHFSMAVLYKGMLAVRETLSLCSDTLSEC
ncbi:cytochrome P450 [Aspergillus karnatakaensis]|uniref:cytochrome P450 n=1 Tax=Aspergillus karnatakaensis TaxID=1810916 RepID=UPI003CCCB01B